MRSRSSWLFSRTPCVVFSGGLSPNRKPAITLDEFLNTTDISAARLSPDGSSAGHCDRNARLEEQRLPPRPLALDVPSRACGRSPTPAVKKILDGAPTAMDRVPFRPRSSSATTRLPTQSPNPKPTKPRRLWIISASGGEALPLLREKLDVHTFSWSPDSSGHLLLRHRAAHVTSRKMRSRTSGKM